ncbi:MAG TPA: IS1595 family transposase, partial [Aridibacter sp.]|nr:IS1595 family transposase [Aridibacter sp.]
MSSNYKRFKRARISDRKIRHILRLFALDLTAVQIAALTRLNRNTV